VICPSGQMALYAPPTARSGEPGMSIRLEIFRIRQRNVSSELAVDGRSSAAIFSCKSCTRKCGQLNDLWYFVTHRHGKSVPIWSEIIMRSSSSFVAPSAIAILSTALLCSLSTTAMSQPETGVAAPLPSITVVAPKQVARPRQAARPVHASVAYRSTAPTAQTPPQGSVLGRIAELEKHASSCNGGCETSYKTGNAPWVGCSETGPEVTNFSGTCRDTLSYRTYLECKETKMFLGSDQRKAYWLCSSLLIGGKLSGEKVYVADGSGRR
jgi:hypothetical protein